MTGTASFIFFFGAFTGFLSFPPIAGAIIASAIGGFFYLALATILAQVAFLTFLFRQRCNSPVSSSSAPIAYILFLMPLTFFGKLVIAIF